MLIFTSPLWLSLGAGAAIAGAWGIWRGQRRARPVSSLRLWRSLDEGATSSRRRAVDPAWLLLLLAAVIGAIGAAGPAWIVPPAAATVWARVEWSIRTGPGGTEAWVRILRAHGVPPEVIVALDAESRHDERRVATDRLSAGDIVPVPQALAAEAARLSLSLKIPGQEIASQTFERPVRPFALLERGPVDPALRRVFAIQPGARPEDPTIQPSAILAAEGPVDPAACDLLIAQPAVALPGVTLGEPLTPRNATPEALALPGFIHLDRVHVRTLRSAALSPEWRILAAVDGHPWLARRQLGRTTLVWLASDPSTQTDWPADPSFVLCFADLARQPLHRDEPASDWTPLASIAPAAPASAPVYPLRNLTTAIALILLLTAVALLARRTGAGGDNAGRSAENVNDTLKVR